MNNDPRMMANAIRALSMDAVQKANSGHPGMPMGMADVATALFANHLVFDPRRPDWPNRDRFVLSAGHGSMLLYALLYLTGYGDMTLDELRNFRQFGARTAGHPEYGHAAGIETTTGPLGQGIGNAVGMALAERILAARFGDEIVDHRTYAIAGDGCLMEGVSHEAISLAGHLKLGKLIMLWDNNDISIDGELSLACSDDQLARFAASGWHATACDGHDFKAISDAIEAARKDPRPSLIACKTVIGYGAPNKQGTAATHGAPLGELEVMATRKAIGWPHHPFDVPDQILDAWRLIGARGAAKSSAWDIRLAEMDQGLHEEFKRVNSGRLPGGWHKDLDKHIEALLSEKPAIATRKASQLAIEAIQPVLPEMVGGSADLTGSNLTRTDAMSPLGPEAFGGAHIHYGVREHGMAAAMNGMALHGGVIPYGGTFLVFADYCRPAIRLSALMGQRVIYVMTHDSIGLGEDGPTHQPVEHLASLRAMPNVCVFRPCDAVETAECWKLAIERADGPSVLALSRQATPTLRKEVHDGSARGAYVLRESGDAPAVVLIATGAEVALAAEARKQLMEDGVSTRLVSMPCAELFDQQDENYRADILPEKAVRIAVEAASGFGWERYVGANGAVVGMTGFGASAPAGDLFKHFGFTAEAIVEVAKARLG